MCLGMFRIKRKKCKIKYIIAVVAAVVSSDDQHPPTRAPSKIMSVISSGRKRKIKAETFSRIFAKAARYNDERKALCIVCNHIHKSMITTTTTFVRHLHCHLRRLQRLNQCLFVFYSKT